MADQMTLSQLYLKGREGLTAVGYTRPLPPDAALGAPLTVNRAYLDSLFFAPRFLSSAVADTSSTILGVPVSVPVFCGPMAGWSQLGETALEEAARRSGATLVTGAEVTAITPDGEVTARIRGEERVFARLRTMLRIARRTMAPDGLASFETRPSGRSSSDNGEAVAGG